MTIYYRTTDGRLDINLTQAQYDALAPGKQSALRVYIIDPRPADTALQLAIEGGIVVGPVNANFTWAMRNKTAAEIAIDDLATEKATNAQLIIDIKTQLDIDNPTFNAMTDPQKFQVVRTDRRLLLRASRYLLRREFP